MSTTVREASGRDSICQKSVKTEARLILPESASRLASPES
jgi:hypothetical protein